MNKAKNKNDLLCVKYYIKTLILYNEHQLGTESKDGYQQLLKAQRLNQDILETKHKFKKETIRI